MYYLNQAATAATQYASDAYKAMPSREEVAKKAEEYYQMLPERDTVVAAVQDAAASACDYVAETYSMLVADGQSEVQVEKSLETEQLHLLRMNSAMQGRDFEVVPLARKEVASIKGIDLDQLQAARQQSVKEAQEEVKVDSKVAKVFKKGRRRARVAKVKRAYSQVQVTKAPSDTMSVLSRTVSVASSLDQVNPAPKRESTVDVYAVIDKMYHMKEVKACTRDVDGKKLQYPNKSGLRTLIVEHNEGVTSKEIGQIITGLCD